MSEFNITKQQREYLDSLVCQRISDDEANKKVIEAFSNPKSSPGITGALKTGWNADKKDKVAYYIVKDPEDNQPLLFFSLKCGEMHIPLSPEKLSKSVKSALMLLKAASSACGMTPIPRSTNFREQLMIWSMAKEALDLAQDLEVEDWAKEVIEKQLVDGDLPDKAWNDIWRRVFRSRDRQESLNEEMKREGENIIRTKKTFAAVELVHFCVHEPARKKWKAMGMGKRMGKALFWHFIEPIIRALRDLVGCEYIYLFAADRNRDGRLVKYYKELGFDFRDDINVTKPAYDFCCYFMCQEVTALRTRKNEFMKNYNKPEEPAAV